MVKRISQSATPAFRAMPNRGYWAAKGLQWREAQQGHFSWWVVEAGKLLGFRTIKILSGLCSAFQEKPSEAMTFPCSSPVSTTDLTVPACIGYAMLRAMRFAVSQLTLCPAHQSPTARLPHNVRNP